MVIILTPPIKNEAWKIMHFQSINMSGPKKKVVLNTKVPWLSFKKSSAVEFLQF